MKTKKWFLVLLIVLAGMFVLAGCENFFTDDDDDDDHHKKKSELASNSGTQSYYTVDFIITGGPAVPSKQTVKYGEKVTEPVVRDVLNTVITVNWYTDQQFTMPYYFIIPVTQNVTLYGKWEDNG